MFLYVELWKPRSTWDALPIETREEFLSQLQPSVSKMKAIGVELVGFAVCDEAAENDANYRYLAVWKMPNLGHVHMLEKAIKAEGWTNFFDIINARGKVVSIDQGVKDMVKV